MEHEPLPSEVYTGPPPTLGDLLNAPMTRENKKKEALSRKEIGHMLSDSDLEDYYSIPALQDLVKACEQRNKARIVMRFPLEAVGIEVMSLIALVLNLSKNHEFAGMSVAFFIAAMIFNIINWSQIYLGKDFSNREDTYFDDLNAFIREQEIIIEASAGVLGFDTYPRYSVNNLQTLTLRNTKHIRQALKQRAQKERERELTYEEMRLKDDRREKIENHASRLLRLQRARDAANDSDRTDDPVIKKLRR